MKKICHTFMLFIFVFFLSGRVASQNQAENFDRIESAKVALFNERLTLTPSQAEKFWPLYNEYQSEKRLLRRQLNQGRKGQAKELSEAQAQEILTQRLALREQALSLDRKYISQLVQATSARQMVELGKAEAEFRRILIKRLRERRNDR